VQRLQLPDSPAGFAEATWDDLRPYFETLATMPVLEGEVEAWLGEWSRLEELVTEAAGRAMIAYTADTSDPGKEAAHLRFSSEIFPVMEEQGVRLARRLLEFGYRRADLEVVLRRFRTQIEIFREESVPLFAELEELSARYQRLTGGITAALSAVAMVRSNSRNWGSTSEESDTSTPGYSSARIACMRRSCAGLA